jgi:hypothetical protein
MAAWDRFCLRYRHFTYDNPINPKSLGLPNYCPTLTDVLKITGIPGGSQTIAGEFLSRGAGEVDKGK